MRLRTRLALMLVALAAPLAAGAVWLRADFARRAAVSSLAELARARMESGGREMCEASPATFQEPPLFPRPRGEPSGRPGPPGPPPRDRHGPDDVPPELRGERGERRGVEGPGGPGGPGPPRGGPGGSRLDLFAYAPDFLSANPRAPAFPAELRQKLEAGAREASDTRSDDDQRITTVALRMTWSEGPCAIVLARRHEPRGPWSALHDAWVFGALLLVLVGAVLFAVGPLVRRVRSLEEGVRRSAAGRYREAVAVEGGDEIADLAVAFNAAGAEVRAQIEALEKREKTLRSFVENTTHDVMLPLTVLQGHLTRMRNELASGSMPERDTVREALEESHYLASLVQNLGAAAKLDAGQPALRSDPFSWNTLVERVVLRHRTIAHEKGVELDFAVPEGDVRASGDVTLVEQALSNVVHNAVRYNRRSGHVAILLDARDGRFGVRVFDDGPGVAEAELARLAERSYRGDEARARHPDGMGLGLAIAKDVAERHGFDLQLRKSEAGGLEVEIGGPTA